MGEALKKGALRGFGDSKLRWKVKTAELPNYVMPPFNSTVENEYIVDVTQEVPGPEGEPGPAVDFISAMDTPHLWGLNMWYHALNVGFRTRISGETNISCLTRGQQGKGWSYVRLEGKPEQKLWREGIRQGGCYVSDGKSHLLDFAVNEVELGPDGSELDLDGPGEVRVRAKVAAWLDEESDGDLQSRSYDKEPYWDIERARLGDSREVLVEVVVNGNPVAKRKFLADGTMQDVEFEVAIQRSSWVSLRILPSSHTNPIFVLVDGEPIRASKRSAEWCLKCVDRCWSEKEKFLKKSEAENEPDKAKAAYDHAREVYRERLKGCTED
jgi:hypothetical protein